jgi:hypothetical protein
MKWINVLYQHEEFKPLVSSQSLQMHLPHLFSTRYESQPEVALIVCILIACLAVLVLIFVCQQLRSLFWTYGSDFESDVTVPRAKRSKANRSIESDRVPVRGHLSHNKRRIQSKLWPENDESSIDSEIEKERMREYRDKDWYRSSHGNTLSQQFDQDKRPKTDRKSDRNESSKLTKRKVPASAGNTNRKEEEERPNGSVANSIRFNWSRDMNRTCDCGCRHCCVEERSSVKVKTVPKTKKMRSDRSSSEVDDDSMSSDSIGRRSKGKVRDRHSYERSKSRPRRSKESDGNHPLARHLSKVSRTAPLYARIKGDEATDASKAKSWSSHFHLSRPHVSRCHFDSS